MPQLFHFSENPNIDRFVPRPGNRAIVLPGESGEAIPRDLVWAIDRWHEPMYLFPRECPRILLWPLAHSEAADVARFFTPLADDPPVAAPARMVAYVESRWLPRIDAARLFRYEMPDSSFIDLRDAGMWVSRQTIVSADKTPITNLRDRLAKQLVVLRSLEDLTPLRDVWSTSLHASGIRLGTAARW